MCLLLYYMFIATKTFGNQLYYTINTYLSITRTCLYTCKHPIHYHTWELAWVFSSCHQSTYCQLLSSKYPAWVYNNNNYVIHIHVHFNMIIRRVNWQAMTEDIHISFSFLSVYSFLIYYYYTSYCWLAASLIP